MDSRAQGIIDTGERLFSSRGNLMSYWQEIAENFYPERADFTTSNTDGDFWQGLMTSEPVIKRRELGDQIQALTRPDAPWFGLHVVDEQTDTDPTARKWLEHMTRVQRRAMYAASAGFSKAAKDLDHDWVTFGMGVMEIDARRDRSGLIYLNHHIRDFAWTEDYYRKVAAVYRRWKPLASTLVKMFPATVHSSVREAATKDKTARISCYHAVIPRDDWEETRKRSPRASWVSVYIDKENGVVLEETPMLWNKYVIPRWRTIADSQYAWSPATGPGLADARTLQSVVRVLLEAGEKAVDPPLVAVEDALRSDAQIYAGGITFLEAEYDERLGGALRPLITNPGAGMPAGLEMADRLSVALHIGFFLNKINLPEQKDMTAYETQKRVEEFIRANTPLLTPIEDELNNAVCERTFEVLTAFQAFGPPEQLPAELQGQSVRYEFVSPFRQMAGEMDAMQFRVALETIGAAQVFDPLAPARLNMDQALPDALQAGGVPAKWITGNKEFAAIKQRAAQVQQQQQQMEQMGQVAQVASTAAPGIKAIADMSKAA
jgi:hypothetical protein